MERTISYFDRFELFQNKDGQPERATTTALISVTTSVDDWYDSFWEIALKYCDGNLRAAEHFMDTSVFMFYYRIKQKASWLKWQNQQMKATG